MASQSLISAVNSYDNYIQRKGIDEQVIDAYIEACRVAINSEKDITYPIMSSIRFSGSMLFGDIRGTYLHFLTPSSIICVFTTI